jgi:dimethylaniline monooxygenase (N-oxide forming)
MRNTFWHALCGPFSRNTLLKIIKDRFYGAGMTEKFPKNEQVMEYLSSYAKHFGLLRCIKFGHRVLAIEFVGVDEVEMRSWEMWSENGEAFGKHRGEWHLTVQKSEQKYTEVCQF